MPFAVLEHQYKDLLIFLVVAGVVAPLVGRGRVNPVLAFLVAGVALGPEGLGRPSPLPFPLWWPFDPWPLE